MAYQTWIQLCGRLAVERGGQRVESKLPGRQGRMLLGYLVAHRDRPVPRDELIWALWGDVAPDGSDDALNAVVSKTRRVVGADHLTGRGDLRFVSGEETFVDLQWAIDCLHRAETYTAWSQWQEAYQPAHTAYAITRRPFLLGLDTPWIDTWRGRLQQMHIRALEHFAIVTLRLGGALFWSAEQAARELQNAAPFSETGYWVLMEVLAQRGDQAGALTVYDKARRLLRDELGVDPGPELQRVYRQLLGQPTG